MQNYWLIGGWSGAKSGQAMAASRTVLVVEDDADLMESIKAVVEDLGWRAICATNGREALSLLEREHPAVMLVDLFMPVMNGIELLRAVKRNERLAGIPRVIMTAANDSMIGVKEDVPVLYKPVDIEALSRLLQQYCEPIRTPAT